jgi:hypothetical protein
VLKKDKEKTMHRWIVFIPPSCERYTSYYKLHIYHAEFVNVKSIEEALNKIDEESQEDAITYVIAPAVLYRNFTQRVIELFREDYSHAYDLTATIGIDAFRDGRRTRKVKTSIPWIVEWTAERWRGAGHIPQGVSLKTLSTLETEYRVFPLTSWDKTSDCELDGYP